MKKGFVWTGMLIVWATVADAQVKTKTTTNTKKKAPTTQATPAVSNPSYLIQRGQYQAKRTPPFGTTGQTFSISDPTIRTLNHRANGAAIPMDSKEILGVPKMVYGLGNGQLLFRSRGATTSGTGTGSGTVGTGSSTGPIGMHGLTLGVNGKSPYAGPIMDGMIVTDINKEQAVTNKREQRPQLKNKEKE